MSRDRREEAAAQRVVEAIEQVRLVPRDVQGAPPGTHDFDIEQAGTVVGALEVTMLLDFPRQRQGWINTYGFFKSAELSRNWYVAFSDQALRLKKSRETLELLAQALRDLELRGLENFERRRWIPPTDEPMRIEQLPVLLAISSKTEGVARVSILAPSQAGGVWAGNTHAVIEEALTGERFLGERAKLARSGVPERHLYVWIGDNLFAASARILLEEEPFPAVPSLPEEITTLWVASPAPEGTVVWRSSGEPWERLVVPSA